METDRPGNRKEEVKDWIKDFLATRDKKYLGYIYEKNKQALFFHCLRLIQNQEDAKDLTSEAFIRAFEHLDSFNPNRPFYPWLSQIATNLCIDFIRRKSRVYFNAIDESKMGAGDETVLDALQRRELGEKIKAAINKLKKPQKRCFYLFYIHEKSYKEIVQLTGYSYKKVRSCIQNGRRKFKLIMERES